MSPLGVYLLETLVTLLGVIALSVLVLYAARRFGVGRPAGPLALVGKLPLDGRRAVYLVRVGPKLLVVGASEGGLSKLGEIDGENVELTEDLPRGAAFADVLARVAGRKRESRSADRGEAGDGEEAAARGAREDGRG